MRFELRSIPLPAPSMNRLHQLVIDGAVVLERVTVIDSLEVTWFFTKVDAVNKLKKYGATACAECLRSFGMSPPSIAVGVRKVRATMNTVAARPGRPAGPAFEPDDDQPATMQRQPYQLAQADAGNRPLVHTKTPWRFIPNKDNVDLGDSEEPVLGTIVDDEFHIARIWSDNPNAVADAAFIITACNNHDELVAACEAVETAQRSGDYAEAFKAVSAILAKVRS